MRAERKRGVRMPSKLNKLLVCSLTGLTAVDTAAAQQTTALVRVDSGQLQGAVEDGVVSYKGIPFAAPPIGEMRWRPPQPVAPWTGVREASEFEGGRRGFMRCSWQLNR